MENEDFHIGTLSPVKRVEPRKTRPVALTTEPLLVLFVIDPSLNEVSDPRENRAAVLDVPSFYPTNLD
jgi:hypothetical protein